MEWCHNRPEFGADLPDLSSIAGSGKTAVFTSLIHRLPPLIHPYTGQIANKVLIIVGAIQLAKQAVETVRRAYPDLSVELEQGNNRATGSADVTVATYQVRSAVSSRARR